MFRQGDVLLIPTTPVEIAGAETAQRDDRGRLVLAEGEATGHAHAIAARRAALYMMAGMVYLHLQERAQVQHEEHGNIDLDPGWYKVQRKREYTPAEVRYVAD